MNQNIEGKQHPVTELTTHIGSGSKVAQKYCDEVRPRADTWDSKRNPKDNGLCWGDSLRVHGSFAACKGKTLEGKFVKDFLVWLGAIFGEVTGSGGICLDSGDITNKKGDHTGKLGTGTFVSPVDITFLGEREKVILVTKGYFHLDENGKIVLEGEEGKTDDDAVKKALTNYLSLKPRPESFWADYLAVEEDFLDLEEGGYNARIKERYAETRDKLLKLYLLMEKNGLITYLDRVVTANFQTPDETTDSVFREASRKIFEEAKAAGVKNPPAGTTVVERHPDDSVRRIVHKFPEFDLRSDEEKKAELPPASLLKERFKDPKDQTDEEKAIAKKNEAAAYYQFWLGVRDRRTEEIRSINERIQRVNQWIGRKNEVRKRQEKELWPLWSPLDEYIIPEVPVWRTEKLGDGSKVDRLYMTPIIPFPQQPDRPLREKREKVVDLEERRHLWIEGFYVSVPVYAGKGDIEILISPDVPEVKLSPEEILTLISGPETEDKRQVEWLVRGLAPKKPELSTKAIRELRKGMKELPKQEVEVTGPPNLLRRTQAESPPQLPRQHSGFLRGMGKKFRETYRVS